MPKLTGGNGDGATTVEEVGGENGAVTIRRTRGKAAAANDGEAAATDATAAKRASGKLTIPELLTVASKSVQNAAVRLSAKSVTQEVVLACASDLFKAARQLYAVGKAE